MDKSREVVPCDELSLLMGYLKQGQTFDEAFSACSKESPGGSSDFGHRLIAQLKEEACS